MPAAAEPEPSSALERAPAPRHGARPRSGSGITVLNVIDRYLLRQILAICLVMTAIGLTVLLLERVLYLFSLVANPSNALSYVGQMLLMLTPHYLSIALPAAFFFGVLLTFGRLKQDGEFVVLMAAGCGLGRLLAPVIALALIMTLMAVLILGFLNPHAHYAYRALKHTVAQASLNAAVLEGTFIQADGLTFFAEAATFSPKGLELSKVFVYQKGENGETVVVTGRNGSLARGAADGRPVLMLEKGVRAEIAADGSSAGALSFGDLSWPVDTETEAFRDRGRDQKELTLTELWQARRDATPASKPSAAEIAAELHSRLVQIASVPLLPLLAAPLALAGPVRSRRSGIVIGLLIIIVYYEALNFGDAMVKRELLHPAIALWLPFALFLVGTGHLLRRTLQGRHPVRGILRRPRPLEAHAT
jgi:lipopolysaccharide export system permease protein